MAKTIIRDGMKEPLPEDAFVCPNCGSCIEHYEFFPTDIVQKILPIFACDTCGCIWQWEKDE